METLPLPVMDFKFRSMLGAQGFWAGRDLYHATPAVTRDHGFSGLIRRTAPFSHLLRHTRGYGGSIVTRIPTSLLSVAFFDTQGDVEDQFSPGSSWVCRSWTKLHPNIATWHPCRSWTKPRPKTGTSSTAYDNHRRPRTNQRPYIITTSMSHDETQIAEDLQTPELLRCKNFVTFIGHPSRGPFHWKTYDYVQNLIVYYFLSQVHLKIVLIFCMKKLRRCTYARNFKRNHRICKPVTSG
jgi:hypothetical protein